VQLLIHRARHADVLEYLWWLNSHHKHLYKYLHGDKVRMQPNVGADSAPFGHWSCCSLADIQQQQA
jgi:hypothetical protein